MVDHGLAGPCTDSVGVANSVGALWSLGGGAWLICGVVLGLKSTNIESIPFIGDAHIVCAGASWPVIYHANPGHPNCVRLEKRYKQLVQ